MISALASKMGAKENEYCIVASTNTCYTIQKIKSLGLLQFEFYVVKGGATNRDVLVLATIRYLQISLY